MWLETLFYLFTAHAVTDYALQSDFMASRKRPSKSRHLSDEYGPWWWWMTAHSLINGLGVAIVLSSWYLGVAEAIVHGLADTYKCQGKITTYQDQALHLLSKVVWMLMAA